MRNRRKTSSRKVRADWTRRGPGISTDDNASMTTRTLRYHTVSGCDRKISRGMPHFRKEDEKCDALWKARGNSYSASRLPSQYLPQSRQFFDLLCLDRPMTRYYVGACPLLRRPSPLSCMGDLAAQQSILRDLARALRACNAQHNTISIISWISMM